MLDFVCGPPAFVRLVFRTNEKKEAEENIIKPTEILIIIQCNFPHHSKGKRILNLSPTASIKRMVPPTVVRRQKRVSDNSTPVFLEYEHLRRMVPFY
ncbi:hypothetical protein NPIL_638931 [Nephila pilipes]|uniref:Uncharacterized protein n=1 Tax=Nephila pilipes TaxID=299642 RepID=A0A8X6NF43_NEPPI|nr:hypothetical protein NPIL_638931 [Nephila pilipes]